MWRNYRLSLSFANLVYLRAWADLIPLRSTGLFHRKNLPGFGLYLGLVGDVLVLSLLIFLFLQILPKLPALVRRLVPLAAFAVMGLSCAFFRTQLSKIAGMSAVVAFGGVLLLGAAFVTFRYPALAANLVKGAILAATPCLAVTFIAPLFYLNSPSPLPPDPPLAATLPGKPPVRVIWVLFDDWDQRLTFDVPEVTSTLPSLNEFLGRSFAANRALAVLAGATPVPAMATNSAVPSLLYGKLMTGSEIQGPATRELTFAGAPDPVIFGQGDNIFSRFRERGWNSAVAGWFLPYCRIFNSVLTSCYWDEMYDQASSASSTPIAAGLDEIRMLFETDMYSAFGRSLVDARHFAEYNTLVSLGKRYAADPTLGLAFIHMNVPHAPYFYSREARAKSGSRPDALYIENLKWVDRAVGEIVASVKASDLESSTAIILSSDHPGRLLSVTDPHVPFIVHLPGELQPGISMNEFSAMGTADLAMAIANGRIQSPRDIESFMVSRR